MVSRMVPFPEQIYDANGYSLSRPIGIGAGAPPDGSWAHGLGRSDARPSPGARLKGEKRLGGLIGPAGQRDGQDRKAQHDHQPGPNRDRTVLRSAWDTSGNGPDQGATPVRESPPRPVVVPPAP